MTGDEVGPGEGLTDFELAYRNSEARKKVEEARAYRGERRLWRPGPPTGTDSHR